MSIVLDLQALSLVWWRLDVQAGQFNFWFPNIIPSFSYPVDCILKLALDGENTGLVQFEISDICHFLFMPLNYGQNDVFLGLESINSSLIFYIYLKFLTNYWWIKCRSSSEVIRIGCLPLIIPKMMFLRKQMEDGWGLMNRVPLVGNQSVVNIKQYFPFLTTIAHGLVHHSYCLLF